MTTKVIAVRDGLAGLYHRGDVADLVKGAFLMSKFITVSLKGRNIEVLKENWQPYEKVEKKARDGSAVHS